MPYCAQCNFDVERPCVAANDNEPSPHPIRVASDWELRRLSYFRRLAVATANLGQEEKFSRRRFADWLAEVVFFYEGEITWTDGLPYSLPDTLIDDVFGDDQSFRWLSDFVRFAKKPPRQRPQLRILPRLRLISLAFQIAHPAVARHFCR